uniref:Uncharacterized protein n=1 Tax=Talaromyces marneffei PM1 TaxID=1077442 RepID=A0A093VHQ3_TALMA
MSLEPPALSDHWFASLSLPHEDNADLEKPCHSGSVENRETWWGRIWRLLLSLVFKTETSAALSRANGNVLSTSNTRVSSDRPAPERGIVTETPLVEPVAIYTAGLPRARPDPQSLPTFEETIRVRPPPPPPTLGTLGPCQDGLLSDRELDDLFSFIQTASHISPRMSFSGLKHTQILRISCFTMGECITDAELRHTKPATWVSINLECITSWLRKHGIDCRPGAPLGCGWFCFFNPDEETLKLLGKAETCKPFDIDDTTYPSLEYMEDEPGTRLEPRAFWLMELRRSLQHFYTEKEAVVCTHQSNSFPAHFVLRTDVTLQDLQMTIETDFQIKIMVILFRRVILDICEKMLNNPDDRELGRSLILEYFSLPPDDNNMMEDREYDVLLGFGRTVLDEKERHWRTES